VLRIIGYAKLNGAFEMHTNTYNRVAAGLVVLLLALSVHATLPQDRSIVVSSNGDGIVKIRQEQFKVTAAVVKLTENGEVEINVISEITVFVSGRWTRTGDAANGIDLEITGGTSPGSLEGSGKLFLSDDGKSITSLKLEVVNKTTKRQIVITFVGR
jgi:hypothetical protein